MLRSHSLPLLDTVAHIPATGWIVLQQATPGGCTPPSSLQPVFDLLQAITQVTMLAGLTLAALGIAIGGILFMWPGQDQTRRAKSTITYTVMGTVIVLSAHAIVAFVRSQMGTTICA